MSEDTSWDIESYRTAYESEEHWALKRDFMEAHKDRIPETRLICLAQVFVNVELLGCKYPDPVMEQVAVLARDVGHDYKESKKKKLQRTFVKASDAAGAKVKGTSTPALLGASPCNKPPLSTEQSMSMSSRPTASMSSLLPGPAPTPMSSMDIGRHTSMSSLLGQPPSTLASRLATLSNPVSFVKAGVSNPLATLGGSPNAMPGGSSLASNSVSSLYGGSSSMTSMPGGSSSNSMSSMYGGSSNMMSMRGGSSSSNSMASTYGGSSNTTSMPGGSSSNTMSSNYGGSSNTTSLLGRSSSSSNAMSSMYGGSLSGGSSSSSNAMSSMYSGSSNSTSLLGGPPSLSNSMSLMFGGNLKMMSLLGGSSASNSLSSMSSGSATPKTTLITAPPAPKKKKSKADKDKPITEKFVKFIGGKSDTSAPLDNTNRTSNTVPLQKFGGKFGETSGQSGRFGESPQPGQSQPSTTAAATPQHNHLSNWCKVVGRDNPLAGFVLVRHENHDNNGAAAAILNTSSCFSRIPINYHYQKVDHLFECTVNINGVDVVTAKAIGRKKAREQAVVEAVAVLPKHCFTLKIKKSIRAESVTLDQVANDLAARTSFSDNPLATSSVANKMMKQMGWTGGGLGKKGEGITEPIRPSEVFGRQGLGHIETNKGAVTPAFRKRVRDIISEYASNTKNVALAFSNEFSKEQRAEIHKIARLCHLKSASRGKDGKNRCLVISRKVPAQDLLLRLLQEGSNDQYQLLPPSSAC